MNIGDNIKAFRKEKGISQKELARILNNMPISTLANYENNHRLPNLKTVSEIARALEVPIEDLVENPFGTQGRAYINDNGQETFTLLRSSGDISKKEAIEALTKYIDFIANSENYIMDSEYSDIIKSTEELIRGKILILKKNRGSKVK